LIKKVETNRGTLINLIVEKTDMDLQIEAQDESPEI